MRSRHRHFGSSARKRRMSSYNTRMISMSDIEEPTWPRSPPCSVRTTSRRRYFERSSSGDVAMSISRVAWAPAMLLRRTFPVKPRGNSRALASWRVLISFQLSALPGKGSLPPELGNKLIEHDQNPAAGEQRQISRTTACAKAASSLPYRCVAARRNLARCAGGKVLPGWSRISAVIFTGSSQPKYSKSTNAKEPSLRRKLLWKPKSDGTRLRHSCGSSPSKSRPPLTARSRAPMPSNARIAGAKECSRKSSSSLSSGGLTPRSLVKRSFDLPHNLPAGKASFGRKRLRRGATELVRRSWTASRNSTAASMSSSPISTTSSPSIQLSSA